MALVVHDALSHGGLLPWRTGSGPLGVLVFVASLAYTIVSRTLRREPVSELRAQPGDRIVLCTDGVVEAMRQDGEMFGVERLSGVIAQPHDGLDGLLSSVMSAVTRFAGRGGPLDDDSTMIALEIEPHHL
jgi:sigma-B regulation protein RsbU (phosphoserine phosphatase)